MNKNIPKDMEKNLEFTDFFFLLVMRYPKELWLRRLILSLGVKHEVRQPFPEPSQLAACSTDGELEGPRMRLGGLERGLWHLMLGNMKHRFSNDIVRGPSP